MGGGGTEADDASEITALIRQAISQTRDLARGLSPVVLQSKGLAVALEDLASSVAKHNNVNCTCTVSPGFVNPPTDVATHLYRIAQEAVTNAVKHGLTKEIDIELSTNPLHTVLSIHDKGNGRGITELEPKRQGMGLRIMKYRADMIGGILDIQRSQSGSGTTVVCTIPTSPAST